MNPKASATLEKACEDRRRSNFKKALSRLEEGIEKFPRELRLHTEAIDVGMEAGQSLQAIQFFKRAQQKFPDDAFELWAFAAERVAMYNDPIVGRFLLEQAIKNGELSTASAILDNLKDHAVGELLERIKTKKHTMSAALGMGSAARNELASYTLTEALLHVRLRRFPEATERFVRVLDENPALSKTLEPFLTNLQTRHGEIGEMSFALGCCYLAGAGFSRAIETLGRAARTTPSLAAAAIQRIEAIADHPELPPDVRHLKLAQLYIGQGEYRRASDLLRATLERNPAKAGDIVDILRPAVTEVGEHLDLHCAFVDAAFAAGRRETAFGQLRKIYQDRNHRTFLIEWLESKSQSRGGVPEVQLFFAEMALSEGLHGKAIEIVKEILSHGPQEEPAVREVLSKFQSVPAVRQFYSDRFPAPPATESESSFELERYENGGFEPHDTLPLHEELGDPSAARRAEAQPTADPQFRVDGFSFGEARERSPGPSAPSHSDFDNRDFSLRMHGPSPTEETTGGEADGPTRPSDEDSDLFDYLGKDFTNREPSADWTQQLEDPGSRSEPVEAPADETKKFAWGQAPELPEEQPVCETREAQVVLPGTDAAETAAVVPEGAPEQAAERPATETEEPKPPVEESDLPRDFDSLHQLFLDGKLDRARTLEVIERAFEEGRMEEMKTLLSFEPANLGEEIARRYHLARYYLAKDQPMPALVALRSIHLGTVSKEERKNILLRLAECYRALHNFEAAHAVYLRIMSEHPGIPDLERVARSNYASYIEMVTGTAPTLEKVTTA